MISRRKFLKIATVSTILYPFSRTMASTTAERTLNLYNIHTDEGFEITYFRFGKYDQEALERINYLLRCHYKNEVSPINVKVIDLLCAIKDAIGSKEKIEIISGYRSEEYNSYLISIGRKVANNSMHMRGLAIDFSINGISKKDLYNIARSFVAGGVGRYTEFIHIDTGPVRYW